ncbi:alpha/beta hydrolase [Sphingomicrobium lutaoense]|uniref:Putative alpha/beta superfamily hydrolase n=1 Tax=Sphingomicrobium lutaoense TaxID=515949 RepID=A0A839YZQ2_9SPHN|nr:alpha/beta hydrolase-fold protein [Sphingomicrobium lutaoense]MBB3764599.1 putative alpha/beta superfamily hydrolase [Sphingomicrobium lutaoense]
MPVMLIALLLGWQQPEAPAMPQVTAGKLEQSHLSAPHLRIDRVWVWLPPSYGTDPERRYPVLYMHDGQNLFDPSVTYYKKSWELDQAVPRMAEAGDLREWIVVGVESPRERYLTLFPEKLVDHLPPHRVEALASVSEREKIEREALKGDEYLSWLTGTVKPMVDRTYRTLAGPEDTGVMGSSMGGLMSLYAIAEYPHVFGQAAAVSIHYPLGEPEQEDVAANVADTTAAWASYFETTELTPGANRIYMDHGTATLDAHYPPYADAFDAMMEARGWGGANYMSRRYTGAEHDEIAWAERIDIPLAFLDRNDP